MHRTICSAARNLYTNRVKWAFERFGLHSSIRKIYWFVLRGTAGETVEICIGDVSAEYYLTNLSSYGVINATREDERDIVRRLLSELNEDDTFWDVGANIGVYTCLVGDMVMDGNVVAFEPYSPNVTILEENGALNGVDLIVQELALSDTDYKTPFYVMYTQEEGTQEGSIDLEYTDSNGSVAEIIVDNARGDEIIRAGEVPSPDIVKMDIEGAAPEAIRGMKEILQSSVRLLVVEPHGNFHELENLLAGLGFDLEYVNRGADTYPTIFAYTSDSNSSS